MKSLIKVLNSERIFLLLTAIFFTSCGGGSPNLPDDQFHVNIIVISSEKVDPNASIINRKHFNEILKLLNSARKTGKTDIGKDEYLEIELGNYQKRKFYFKIENGNTYLKEKKQYYLLKDIDLISWINNLN